MEGETALLAFLQGETTQSGGSLDTFQPKPGRAHAELLLGAFLEPVSLAK